MRSVGPSRGTFRASSPPPSCQGSSSRRDACDGRGGGGGGGGARGGGSSPSRSATRNPSASATSPHVAPVTSRTRPVPSGARSSNRPANRSPERSMCTSRAKSAGGRGAEGEPARRRAANARRSGQPAGASYDRSSVAGAGSAWATETAPASAAAAGHRLLMTSRRYHGAARRGAKGGAILRGTTGCVTGGRHHGVRPRAVGGPWGRNREVVGGRDRRRNGGRHGVGRFGTGRTTFGPGGRRVTRRRRRFGGDRGRARRPRRFDAPRGGPGR